ncbi:hypothetical protein KBC79_01880 [Candidatus Woesebacteria bacterium]|nr:hypothetical protein [Candidatus Woesebacteria bacterium]
MNITGLYSKYSIPLNLQRHMLSVAAFASCVCDLFSDTKINKDLIVKTSLLHDMGNVLKFNFSRSDLFDEEDLPKIEEYKTAQQHFLKKYGTNPDEATLKIIEEITDNDNIRNLCQESHWEQLEDYLHTDRWDIKICCYSDMRTGPFGLLSLSQRISDLKLRRPEESAQLDVLFQQGTLVEKQLENATEHRLSEIDDGLINRTLDELKNMEI